MLQKNISKILSHNNTILKNYLNMNTNKKSLYFHHLLLLSLIIIKMFESIFGLSLTMKISMLLTASSLVLFGVGYVLKNTTEFIDEVTENNNEKTIACNNNNDEKD